jgi:hypothetical protein
MGQPHASQGAFFAPRGRWRLSRGSLLFLALAALLIISRLCHTAILWEGDTLPIAAAGQMLHGKVLYRDIWYDKPPLVPAFFLLTGARAGWPLRIAGALYCLLACWLAWRMARTLWSEREAFWAAALLGFFLIFDVPSAVVPVASDLLMLAPHLAAVWMAAAGRPFWSGVLAGIAFWISPKGLFVAAICAVWNPAGILWIAAGFAAVCGAGAAALALTGALGSYWDQVWKWGRLYAGNTFLEHPIRNGLIRTANWLGFHIALVVSGGWALARAGLQSRWRWLTWLLLSFAGLAAGLRFFPRYYFILLAPMVVLASRGFQLLGRKREFAALLLLIPATRFGPSYLTALTNPEWRDTAMDRDCQAVATIIRQSKQPGDTLFVWGYRPEIYAYTRMPAATMYLDSQPLTGVPADRHLTQSEPVETETPRRRRAELARSDPTFIVDGLGLLNPKLAISSFPDLRPWLSRYLPVAQTGQSVIYRKRQP